MATTSEVDLCNLALDLLNVGQITSIEKPATVTEELCSRWYDQTRKEALRRHPWNFAGKRAILAPDSTDPLFGFSSQFPLPTDYIRIMYLNESVTQFDNPIPSNRYTIEDGKILIGNILGADTTQIQLIYVSDFTNVPQMDAGFISYFYTLLAQNMSYKLTQQNSAVERVNALMDQAEGRARAMDGQENPPRRIERSRNRRARRQVGSVRNFDGTIVFD